MNSLKAGMLAALVVVPLTCAAAPNNNSAASSIAHRDQRETTAVTQWQSKVEKNLSQRSDADSLVTAALLNSHSGPASKTLDLLEQAAKRDPKAPDIAALSMLTCGGSSGCDPLARGRHLRALAPDNALSWMPALGAALEHKNTHQVTDIVQRMAQAGHFQTYLPALATRIRTGMDHVPVSPSSTASQRHHVSANDARTFHALDLVTAMPMPGYQNLTRACRPSAAEFVKRRAACRQIAGMLEHSETVTANSIGAALSRWTAPDAQGYKNALSRGRNLDWLLKINGAYCVQAARVTCANTELHATSERKVLLDIAHLAGKSIMPPADWTDSAQEDRLQDDYKEFRNVPNSAAALANAKIISQHHLGNKTSAKPAG